MSRGPIEKELNGEMKRKRTIWMEVILEMKLKSKETFTFKMISDILNFNFYIRYHCLKCRKEFTSNELLLNHISKQHPNITEEISTGNKKTIKSQTICGICNKNFANRKNLERHRLIHEREKTQKVCKCHICGNFMKN